MTAKEHKKYIEELRALTSELLKSKEASAEFYKSAGIHTKSGKLTSVYTSSSTPIGYKTSNSKK